jgi:hypothetical protein
MVMKLALLASPISLAAVLVARPDTSPTPIGETEEDRACSTEGSEFGHARVRVPWTPIRRLDDEIQAYYCVFTGDGDSPLPFERNAERVRFTLTSSADVPREEEFQFIVHTSENRSIELRRASIRVAPRGQPSCRIEICQAFTDPGERVVGVEVSSSID